MRRVGAVVLCVLASAAAAHLGTYLGRRWLEPGPGRGAPDAPDLFRFDALYYFDIATRGYAYDGDAFSSPNIVFAPLFPLAVRFTPGLDARAAGFVINFAALVLATVALLAALARWFGARVARGAVLAQLTCAGSYAFHAYYAESLALLAIALVVWGYATARPGVVAGAAAALGASRAVGLVPAVVVAFDLARRTARGEIAPARGAALVMLSLIGSVAYLSFVAARFGNPFVLLPTIQSASWGLFHPPTDWTRVIDGSYLVEYLGRAFHRPFDIRTINLAWTVLMLASIPAAFGRGVPRAVGAFFGAYALATYALDASSEYLISAHRFAALMTPIFVGGVRVARAGRARWGRAVGGLALALNAGFALWHAACFNQGWWFYF